MIIIPVRRDGYGFARRAKEVIGKVKKRKRKKRENKNYEKDKNKKNLAHRYINV